MGTTTFETWHFLLKLRICIPCNSAVPFLTIYLTGMHQESCTGMFAARLFVIAPKLETTQRASTAKMDKPLAVYPSVEIPPSNERKTKHQLHESLNENTFKAI